MKHMSMAFQNLSLTVTNSAGVAVSSVAQATKSPYKALKSFNNVVNKKGRLIYVWGVKPVIQTVRMTSSGGIAGGVANLTWQLLRRNVEQETVLMQNNLHGNQDLAWEYLYACPVVDFRQASGGANLIADFAPVFDAEFFKEPIVFPLMPMLDGRAVAESETPSAGVTLSMFISWGLYLYYEVVEVSMQEYRKALDGYTQLYGGEPR